MNDLVFIEPTKLDTEPFTTSDVIAQWTGNNYRSVQRTIEKHIEALETFGRVRFEITPTQTRGGVQDKKIYYLNEPQATLLITFLKNTPVVVEFKTELVRQFYAMRTELLRRQMCRQQLKPIRRELTDVIKENQHSKWDFKMYTDLAYKVTIGKNAAQLRKERNAPKNAAAIDYMTADEIARVTKSQYQIGVLVEMGMDYQQIKALLVNRQMIGKIA